MLIKAKPKQRVSMGLTVSFKMEEKLMNNEKF